MSKNKQLKTWVAECARPAGLTGRRLPQDCDIPERKRSSREAAGRDFGLSMAVVCKGPGSLFPAEGGRSAPATQGLCVNRCFSNYENFVSNSTQWPHACDRACCFSEGWGPAVATSMCPHHHPGLRVWPETTWLSFCMCFLKGPVPGVNRVTQSCLGTAQRREGENTGRADIFSNKRKQMPAMRSACLG